MKNYSRVVKDDVVRLRFHDVYVTDCRFHESNFTSIHFSNSVEDFENRNIKTTALHVNFKG